MGTRQSNADAQTNDNFYTQVHLTAPASVQLCAGGSCSSFNGAAGINRFSQPLQVGQGMSVSVTRNGQTTVNLQPSFTFNGNPQYYNYSESCRLYQACGLTCRLSYSAIFIIRQKEGEREKLGLERTTPFGGGKPSWGSRSVFWATGESCIIICFRCQDA